MKQTAKQSKFVGVVWILTCVLIAIMCLSFSGAWFTSKKSGSTSSATPQVTLSVTYGSSTIQNVTEIDLSSFSSVTLTNSSNIGVYVRIRFTLSCVETSTSTLRGDLNANDYVTLSPTGFVSGSEVSGYDTSFSYYYANNAFTRIAKGVSTTILTQSNISGTSTSVPDGISIKLSMFVEAIQSNNYGLKKWKAIQTSSNVSVLNTSLKKEDVYEAIY